MNTHLELKEEINGDASSRCNKRFFYKYFPAIIGSGPRNIFLCSYYIMIAYTRAVISLTLTLFVS